jgi:long-chain acyl-CoA synthetase
MEFAAPVTSVADVLRGHALARSSASAISSDDRTFTFADLDRRSNQVAQALAADGVGAGDRVAFLDSNSSEFFEVFFGAAKLGAVTVAVSWRLASRELEAVIDDSRAEVVVVAADFADVLADGAIRMPRVKRILVIGGAGPENYEDWVSSAAAIDPRATRSGDDVVLQLYTSGTTGLPKGAMLTERNLLTLMPQGGPTLGLGADSVNLVAMPLFHIGGSGYALMGFYEGCHTVLLRQADPAVMLAVIESCRVTNMFVVPAVLLFLLGAERIDEVDLSTLRTVAYGASPISVDLLSRSLAIFACDFVQVYGLTETTGTVTLLSASDHRVASEGSDARRLWSAGRPLDGVGLRIVSVDTGSALGTEEVGEIWVRSDQVSPGYWLKPEETAAAITADGWFRTGDLGSLDSDGYLYIHDRLKDMIISGGENVYPAEVENVLMSHPAIADVAVIGVPSQRWGETVKAIVVPASGQAPEPAELIDFCRARLAHFKCPTSVGFLDALPRNASGKILKRSLRHDHTGGPDEYEPG